MSRPCPYHSPAMSVAKFRRRVDPRKLAGRGVRLEGDVAIGSLPRLAPLLTGGGQENTVFARLDFESDERERILISGELDASLTMLCQRCLEPVRVPLKSSFQLAMLADAENVESRARFDLVAGCEEGIVPADLIEEELLLAMPFAASHDSVAECGALAQRLAGTGAGEQVVTPGQAEQTEQAKRPFAVLKDFKLD